MFSVYPSLIWLVIEVNDLPESKSQPVRRSLRSEQQKKRTLAGVGTGKHNQLQLSSWKKLCTVQKGGQWWMMYLLIKQKLTIHRIYNVKAEDQTERSGIRKQSRYLII